MKLFLRANSTPQNANTRNVSFHVSDDMDVPSEKSMASNALFQLFDCQQIEKATRSDFVFSKRLIDGRPVNRTIS